jgi:tRNA pseudouridine55 synthase
MNGLVLIDKPAGCTSHDVVNRWRRLANTKRVGHLGTLDPMATGLLALLTGTATRLAQFFGSHDKTYLAEMTLGLVSDTYDAEGEVTATGTPIPDSAVAIEQAFSKFRGRFFQTPPIVSAKKIKGVPAYKLARQHVPVELAPVEVEIKRLEIDRIEAGKIQLLVTCTAGTYIRSLAHDAGRELGCGGILSKLRRIQSGSFTIEEARTLDQLAELAAEKRLAEAIVPAGRLLPQFPIEYVDQSVEAHIRQGRDFRTSPFVVQAGAPFVKALSYSGELIAIGELKFPNSYHPSIVL